ncbi:unnamed protein product (macronuclear) [Paramecium tetraurelia]|uniref:cDENN domain-containing protein n=1 Tax=Paramecium tetraurelia TaxID=5888 RepID=A0EAG4_PARTE|nr:uncharacterized protein GSPATT00025013001 [Paramecium tetraurelia]CAK92281.1 unnamed protein product [Paramecium tetraurelia]|eukprot:XP_001459678.1 hypothetical protein (macronuclear) [Paramecium tetraurelia strain d4-2]
MKSKQYFSQTQDSDEYKAQIKLLEEMNEKLTQENCDLIREITHYQIQLREKDSYIEQLGIENRTLKFELKLALKKEDLYSTVTLDRYKKSFSTIQPQRKRIFETKMTTLHMNYLSPKKCGNSKEDFISPEAGEFGKSMDNGLNQVEGQDAKEINNDNLSQSNQNYSKLGLEISKGEGSNSTPQQLLQEPIVIKQDLSQSQQLKQNQYSLFEEFLIISISKSTLNGLTNDIFEAGEANLMPEILFQHSSADSCYKEQLLLLAQQIHPYGLKVRLEQKTQSMSNLNSILMGGQNYDRLAGAYVITMQSEQTFNKSVVLNNKTQVNLDNICDLISITNINHQLYCVCVDVPDFYDCNVGNNTTKLKKKYFYSLSKTYCFITKAPIIDFFIETIKIIISTLKFKKAEIYSMVSEFEETLGDIDNYFYTSFKLELYNFLTELQYSKLISKCNYKFLQTPLQFQHIHSSNVENYEIEWAISYAFLNMELPHYLILLINMMLEQHICIISSNRTLLSSLLMILPHMIKPFQHIQPTIHVLTAQLMPILDSPVPIICGIVKDSEKGLQNLGIEDIDSFCEEQSQILFFDANKLKFYNLSANLTECKIYTTLFDKLFKTYQQIRQLSVPGHYLADSNDTTMNLSFQILDDTKTYIQDNLLPLIPNDDGEINLNQILDSILSSTQDQILKQITQTQYFSYYIQQKFKL